MIQFSALSVRALKGAPLSCLLVLMFEGSPMGEQLISAMTGYSINSVHPALGLLELYGYVTHNSRYAWQISMDVRQLPLGEALSSECEMGTVDDSQKLRVPLRRSKLINQDSLIKPLLLDDSQKLRVNQIKAVCEEFKLAEPGVGRLIADEMVTAEMLRYHCLQAVRDGQTLGRAIYRSLKHWPAKAIPEIVSITLPEVERRAVEEIPEAEGNAWRAAIEKLQGQTSKSSFETWIRGATLLGVDVGEGAFRIGVGNPMTREKLTAYLPSITETLGALLSRAVRVEIEVM